MADHHDDRLDSALDLLRSRQWAGPATNPVLEKQFMHSTQESRGLNLRLVLGIAGALIGCGAVAAATRPAWRSAIFGPTYEPPKSVATAAPAPTAPTASRTVARTPAPQAPAPVAHIDPDPAPVATAAAVLEPRAEAPAAEFVAVGEADETEWLRTADPDCFYQQALSAYLERYIAGDYEGCAAIARTADGIKDPAIGIWRGLELARLSLSPTIEFHTALDGAVRLNLVVSGIDLTGTIDAGDQVFEFVADTELLADESIITDPQGNVFRIQGGLISDGAQGNWVFTTSVPGTPATPPASPAPRR